MFNPSNTRVFSAGRTRIGFDTKNTVLINRFRAIVN